MYTLDILIEMHMHILEIRKGFWWDWELCTSSTFFGINLISDHRNYDYMGWGKGRTSLGDCLDDVKGENFSGLLGFFAMKTTLKMTS